MLRVIIASLIAGVLGAISSANAEDFYQGKTIKLIAGSQVGASYDSYARIVARHMPRHIPGKPTIIVQNLPAAHGLVAANDLYNLVARDGTTMGVLNRSIVLSSIIGDEKARFKSERFNWLGTAASFADNAYLFVIRAALPQMTIDDVRKPGSPLHVGNSGSPIIAMLDRGLGLNIKMINGYGKSELDLAFERGEVDGVGIAYANLVARHPNWLKKNFIRPLVQFGRVARFSKFPDVPTGREVARNPEQLALVEMAEATLLIAYPFALPPGVPAERVAMIRRAFMETMNDPAYRADVLKGKLDYSPRDGDGVQATIARIAKMSPAVIARYKEVVLSTKSRE
jgi:tripartite-type tricarboxylate transporter receptor subunit TctC